MRNGLIYAKDKLFCEALKLSFQKQGCEVSFFEDLEHLSIQFQDFSPEFLMIHEEIPFPDDFLEKVEGHVQKVYFLSIGGHGPDNSLIEKIELPINPIDLAKKVVKE